jgi:hypothetical protein
VPQGVAQVRCKIGREEYRASGSGYHDHNWGDAPMQTLIHNWYWARAKVGPYTVIASYITAARTYGYGTQIVYMLAKDDNIIADNEARVSFEAERTATDGRTGKPVADITRYTRMPFIKRLIAKTIGFDGAYHRFTGKVMIEKFEREVRVEVFDNQAIWELMYFGKALASARVRES